MRPARAVVLWGLLGVALAGCGGGTRQAHASTATVSRVPVPTHRLPATPKPPSALVRLSGRLSRELRTAGRTTGAVVYDLTAGRTLYSVRGGVTRPPASVEKLYTSLAVLMDLGAGAELQTKVFGTGQLGRGGVWQGNLYLRGAGDPTFGDGAFNRAWEQGYGPTASDVVAQLAHAGIRRVTGWVFGDASLFDARRGVPSSGYQPDIPDLGGQLAALTYDHGSATVHMSPPAFAVRQLVRTMRGAGIRARASRRSAVTSAGADQLASVSSPPMSVLLKLTDVPSDDFFAEMLTKQLGARFGIGGSTAAGAAVISQAVGQLGLTPSIIDGSGLSRQDETSPLQVVELLRSVWGTTNGRTLLAALPVVGVNGTVQRIGRHTPAQGRCQAKTGTLDYVTNLAGYCRSKTGHELAFAVFLQGPSNVQGIRLLGRMVGVIARY